MGLQKRLTFLIVHSTVHFIVIVLPLLFRTLLRLSRRIPGLKRRRAVPATHVCPNCEASHRQSAALTAATGGLKDSALPPAAVGVPCFAADPTCLAASVVPLTVPADKRFCAPYLADDDVSRPARHRARLIFTAGGKADVTFGITRQRQAFLAEAAAAPLYGGHVSTTVAGVFRSVDPIVLHREVVRTYDGVHVAMDWGRSSWYFDAAVPAITSPSLNGAAAAGALGKGCDGVGDGVGDAVGRCATAPTRWYHSIYVVDASREAMGNPGGLALRHGAAAAFYNSFQRQAHLLADAACAAQHGQLVQLPRAVVAICPGLGSKCDSFYIRSLMRHLLRCGYDPVLINTRGLGIPLNRRAKFVCAAITDDVRYLVRSYLSPEALRRRYYGTDDESSSIGAAVPPLFMVGFSMGANLMSKALAEDGATMLAAEAAGDVAAALATTCHQHVKAAIAVSTPWDFFGASFYISRGLNLYLYNRRLAGGVARYWTESCQATYPAGDHDDDARDNVALPPRPAPCLACLGQAPATGITGVSMREFDEAVVAPFYGYPDAETYYRDAEAFRRLHTVRTPLLALSATEDPIVGPARPDAQWERTVNGIRWPFGTAPAEDVRPTTWAEHDALLQKRAAAMQPAPVEHRPPIAYMRVPTGGHIGFLGTPLQEWRGEPNMSERIILRALSNALDA